MKIESVTATPLAVAVDAPVKFGFGSHPVFTMTLVTVTTQDGIAGYGEAVTRRAPQMTVSAVRDLLAPLLIGQDARNIEGLWVRMMSEMRRWGHTKGVVVEAISGIDVALWDAVSRAYGVPAWRLMSGSGREVLPCYASSIYIADAAESCRLATELAARGFRRIKVKIGRGAADGGINMDITVLRAVRDVVGQEVELVVDANGAYDAADALLVAREMESLDIRWFEEPVPADDIRGYQRLRSGTCVPLARGETDFGVLDMTPLVAAGLVDVIQPDLGRCGGLTGARHLSTLALGANVKYAPHTGFSGGISQLAALHAAAASPVLDMVEYMIIDNPLRDLFTEGYPECVDGRIHVPQSPGLGLTLDEAKIKQFSAA
jgi:L-alanine-DL-glutamate epimerase-like enolase superfamily enzyme